MSTTAGFWSLRDKLCMFDNRTFAVKFDVGDLNFTTYKVSLPRGGFRYLWNAMDIYKHLQMDAYKGVASKWVYESLGAWEAKLGKVGLVGHFVKSHASVSKKGTMQDTDHFLPSLGMTTIAMLYLGLMWAHAAVHKGGLRNPTCRAYAKQLVASLVGGACSQPFTLDIIFDKDWQPTWPRPVPHKASCAKVSLQVLPCGKASTDSWKALEEAHDDMPPEHSGKATGVPYHDRAYVSHVNVACQKTYHNI